jgi:GST-like protein
MIKLYTSPTPNGRKISILLEELNAEYETILVDLSKKEQFKKEFSKLSPTNKIPVIVDTENGQRIFESGAILIYLAQKYNKFLDNENYWEIMQWLILQVAYVGPMLGQAHQYLFYHRGKSKFAEEKTKGYVEHVYSILEKQLIDKEYIVKDYSIADIAIWPWVDRCERHEINLEDYPNIKRWYDKISIRPAVIKGYNAV